MVDNRELVSDLEVAPYWTLAAVINAHYARKHNYRFIYAMPSYDERNVTAMVAAAATACSFEGTTMETPLEQRLKVPGGREKSLVVAYHFGLTVRRYAAWAKLMPVWELARTGVNVFYADSDAFVEGLDHTLAEVFSGGAYKEQRAGVKVVDGALVGFLANTPFGVPFPGGKRIACTGAFYVLAREHSHDASDFIRQWWDLPGWEQWHPYEQAALHSTLYADRNLTATCTRIDMAHSYSLVGDDQFEHRRKDPWLQHYGSLEDPAQRELALVERVSILGFTKDTFAAAVAEITPLRFDSLDIALRMHRETCEIQAKCERV